MLSGGQPEFHWQSLSRIDPITIRAAPPPARGAVHAGLKVPRVYSSSAAPRELVPMSACGADGRVLLTCCDMLLSER